MTITKKNLEAMTKRLNAVNGFEDPEWNTIGSFKLYKDGCGYAIHKVHNNGGGVVTVGGFYGMTTKECYFFLSGLLAEV